MQLMYKTTQEQVEGYYKACPVCGEIDDYEYLSGSTYEPSPDEAWCNVCMWSFVETSQHYPTVKSIKTYRRKLITDSKKLIRRLERL